MEPQKQQELNKSSWRKRSDQSIAESGDTPPLNMPPLIWQWLKSRGIVQKDEIENFLTPSLTSLTSPFLLKDMDTAVSRLCSAFEKNEHVCIYGDYDLDGSSGIALLVDGFKKLGFKNVSFYQPSRFLEGYGIHADALEIIKKRGASVVVSVDCGITAIDEAIKAKELGLDLIITDHHLARKNESGDEIIPHAFAVVNPNQHGDESGLGHLSGVGTGFYLLLALRARLGVRDVNMKEFLDLFSIGTVTDMVPLIKENRILVKHGLIQLSKTNRPGLRALLRTLDLENKRLDSQDIAFQIGPKLNALSRLEKNIRPLDLLMCEDQKEADILVEQVMALNDERKDLQKELETKILDQLNDVKDHSAIVLGAPGHAGVVGLVATKVSQLTGKPTFIIAWQDGEGAGSARGPEVFCKNFPLTEALNAGKNLLLAHGGHAAAAGFSLLPENFEQLRSKITEFYDVSASGLGLKSEVLYDVDARLEDINEGFMQWLMHVGPFGQENPSPLFKITIDRVHGVRWLKDLHLKLTIGNQRLDAISFYAKGLYDVQIGDSIELLVEPTWNYWQGRRSVQLMIRDLRPL